MKQRLPSAIVLTALALSLAACGGGGDSESVAATSTDTTSTATEEPSVEASEEPAEAEPTTPTTTAGGEFGAVPAAGAKLNLALDETGNVPIKNHPDACKLLTTEQVTTILPSVTDVKTEGVPRKYIGLGAEGGVTPFPADCDYLLTTPNNLYSDAVDWKVIVDMNTLADPAYVKEQYESRKASAIRSNESAAQTEYPTTFEEYGTKCGGEEAFLDDTFGIVVRSNLALLYVDARLPGYLGEENGGPIIREAKLEARRKVACAAAQAIAPMFAK